MKFKAASGPGGIEKKEFDKMQKDFESKLLRKMDKKLAANSEVVKGEIEAITEKLKVDSR